MVWQEKSCRGLIGRGVSASARPPLADWIPALLSYQVESSFSRRNMTRVSSPLDVKSGTVRDLDKFISSTVFTARLVNSKKPNAPGVVDMLTCRGSRVGRLHLSLTSKAGFGAKLYHPVGHHVLKHYQHVYVISSGWDRPLVSPDTNIHSTVSVPPLRIFRPAPCCPNCR